MRNDTPLWSDGTRVKKWQRVLIGQVVFFHFTMRQAREMIQLNDYLKKHENDLERVFNEMGYIFRPNYDEWDYALEAWKRHFGKI